jgi:very-short-patch-repair endonuclease
LIEFQHGVLARWQAPGCAMERSRIDALLRVGRWQTLYRGVYAAFTGEPSRQSALWAAVRRCGPDAILSHYTAAELDGLADQRGLSDRRGPADRRSPVERRGLSDRRGVADWRGPAGRRGVAIHVTVARDARVRISDSEYGSGLPRIVLHRSARIATARHPARTPPRTRIEETVLDLTQLARTQDGVFTWLSLACARRLAAPDQLRAAAERRVKLRWRTDILLALDEIGDGVCSQLERRYHVGVERAHALPRATRQARMARGTRSAYLDNLYAAFGLAVELDGRAAHPAEERWQDIHRDNFFASSGIVTLRDSWSDVAGRPCHVAKQIALVLRLRGWTGAPRACGPSCPAADG